MKRKLRFFVIFLILFLAVLIAIPAQQRSTREPGFFAGPLAEALWYSADAPAFGIGLVVGGGIGTSIGGRFLYATGNDDLNILELGLFIRSYIWKEANDGPFVQVNAGMVVIDNKTPSLPADRGSFMAGIDVGWRFLFGSNWYIDPSIRAGYPFMVAAGVSAGFRF